MACASCKKLSADMDILESLSSAVLQLSRIKNIYQTKISTPITFSNTYFNYWSQRDSLECLCVLLLVSFPNFLTKIVYFFFLSFFFLNIRQNLFIGLKNMPLDIYTNCCLFLVILSKSCHCVCTMSLRGDCIYIFAYQRLVHIIRVKIVFSLKTLLAMRLQNMSKNRFKKKKNT